MEKINQLEQQKKQLIQRQKTQERKDRNHRLCKRGGLVKKLLPDMITITDEQFEIFLDKILLTEHAKAILADFVAQNTAPVVNPEDKPAEPDGDETVDNSSGGNDHFDSVPVVDPAEIPHNAAFSMPANVGNNVRQAS